MASTETARIYQCAHCGTQFEVGNKYIAHILSAHKEYNHPYSCWICGENFNKMHHLIRHEKTVKHLLKRKEYVPEINPMKRSRALPPVDVTGDNYIEFLTEIDLEPAIKKTRKVLEIPTEIQEGKLMDPRITASTSTDTTTSTNTPATPEHEEMVLKAAEEDKEDQLKQEKSKLSALLQDLESTVNIMGNRIQQEGNESAEIAEKQEDLPILNANEVEEALSLITEELNREKNKPQKSQEDQEDKEDKEETIDINAEDWFTIDSTGITTPLQDWTPSFDLLELIKDI